MLFPESEIIVCETTRKIFFYNLLWPGPHEELNPGTSYKIKVAIYFILTCFVNLPLTLHLILMINEHPNENITEGAAMAIAVYGCMYMSFAYVKKQNDLAILLRDLSNFETFGEPPGFEEKNKQMNLFMKLLNIYTCGATFIYSLIKYFEKTSCKRFNEEKGLDANHCGLLGPLWIPFNIDYFPVFHLCALYVFLGTVLFIKVPLQISFNAFEIVQHIILRMRHLEGMILESFDEKDYKVCREKFTKCILYHIQLLNFAARLQDIFFNSMFGHLALTSSICACIEKQIVDGINTVAGVCHLLGWIMALFVGCIGGQELLDASSIVPEALWNSKWYQADLRVRKDIQIMIMRSQKNLYLKAGSYGIVSYPLFVSVLKMSYSILAMLSS